MIAFTFWKQNFKKSCPRHQYLDHVWDRLQAVDKKHSALVFMVVLSSCMIIFAALQLRHTVLTFAEVINGWRVAPLSTQRLICAEKNQVDPTSHEWVPWIMSMMNTNKYNRSDGFIQRIPITSYSSVLWLLILCVMIKWYSQSDVRTYKNRLM